MNFSMHKVFYSIISIIFLLTLVSPAACQEDPMIRDTISLFDAIRSQDMQKIKVYLRRRYIDPDGLSTNKMQVSFIEFAVESNNFEIVDVLIKSVATYNGYLSNRRYFPIINSASPRPYAAANVICSLKSQNYVDGDCSKILKLLLDSGWSFDENTNYLASRYSTLIENRSKDNSISNTEYELFINMLKIKNIVFSIADEDLWRHIYTLAVYSSLYEKRILSHIDFNAHSVKNGWHFSRVMIDECHVVKNCDPQKSLSLLKDIIDSEKFDQKLLMTKDSIGYTPMDWILISKSGHNDSSYYREFNNLPEHQKKKAELIRTKYPDIYAKWTPANDPRCRYMPHLGYSNCNFPSPR